jgi:di/tricarboxylate transporter
LYDLQVLAIHRKGETIRRKISQIRLRLGDVLLIQGHKAHVSTLIADNNFRALSSDEKIPDRGRAPYAIFAFVGAIALASFNVVPLAIAVILGILVVFVTRCITPEEAYREVEWKALILIGSMLGLGTALEHSGTAQFLAEQIVNAFSHASPIWLLAGFFILTVVLTQPMSNQAAAVVVVPIALQTAIQLGLNPRTFAMMIAIAASCSYLTPLEPSCLMGYGPGNYKFVDFLKVGALLTVLIFALALWMVPLIWPLVVR